MGIDKTNRSVSLLRYLLIISVSNLTELFHDTPIKRKLRGIFFAIMKKYKEITPYSINIHINHVEILFQSLPAINLDEFCTEIKSKSMQRIFIQFPEIKKKMNPLWEKSFLLLSQDQLIDENIQTYLSDQWALRVAKKMSWVDDNQSFDQVDQESDSEINSFSDKMLNSYYEKEEMLQYYCIFCTKHFSEVFFDDEVKRLVIDAIDAYFDLSGSQSPSNILENILIHTNYAEIYFSTIPSIVLSKFLSNLKSVSSRKILSQYPEIRSKLDGLWNKNYFIATQENQFDERLKKYFERITKK